jgi:hypothetical protein
MAFGNKFVRTQNEKSADRVKVTSPTGAEYFIDPFRDPTKMKPCEVTASVRYFLDLQEGFPCSKQKPNRFVHVQRI